MSLENTVINTLNHPDTHETNIETPNHIPSANLVEISENYQIYTHVVRVVLVQIIFYFILLLVYPKWHLMCNSGRNFTKIITMFLYCVVLVYVAMYWSQISIRMSVLCVGLVFIGIIIVITEHHTIYTLAKLLNNIYLSNSMYMKLIDTKHQAVLSGFYYFNIALYVLFFLSYGSVNIGFCISAYKHDSFPLVCVIGAMITGVIILRFVMAITKPLEKYDLNITSLDQILDTTNISFDDVAFLILSKDYECHQCGTLVQRKAVHAFNTTKADGYILHSTTSTEME